MQRLTVSPAAARALLRRRQCAAAARASMAMAAARVSAFSTQQRRLLDAQKSNSSSNNNHTATGGSGSGSGAKKPAEDNPFETNFAGLGLSKNMKVFLIVVVSIFGTMETWMYCKAIWRWWKGGDDKGAAAALQQE
ncbi:hypothetical protein JDV02_008701 [Purpureocillium takamizusanense]|uniref:Uncharacterized protein n=1 Tax=Purpureocillium takamizusanense TaxID=2060973 RepID=A0A9Q8VF00_9HYPO|nr:uncharacterized protein JDV02_008701 [Purpureocillium takamizusanense]UNI22851.1 hypothetical protein JDV02_008701 [Purpureocillium takamizusanense]